MRFRTVAFLPGHPACHTPPPPGLPVSSVSFESVHRNTVRTIVVLVGSVSILPLGFLTLVQFPELSTGVKIASAAGIFVLYGTVFTIGVRKWALTRIRYELDERGL